MAAGVTVHSVLDKISRDHLECPICTHRFIDPTMLDCLHSFCYTCLKALHQQDPNNFILLCPLCSKKTTLEDNTVDSLPKDFKLNALMDEFTVQEQLMEGLGSEVKCQACNDGESPVISRCTDCDYFLCLDCQNAHHRFPATRSHQVYTLAQLRSGEVTYMYRSKIREFTPRCDKHSDQTLSIYCNTCQKLKCTTCAILDHKTPKHELIGIPEALDKCRQEVAEMMVKAKKHKAGFETAMERATQTRNELQCAFTKTKTKIFQKASVEITRVTEEEEKLQQEARRIYEDRIQTFQTAEETNSKEVSQAQHKLDKVDQLMTQGSSNEILHLKHKLLKILDEITNNPIHKMPSRMSFLDLKEGRRSIGRLLLDKDQQLEVETAAQAAPTYEAKTEEQTWELKKAFNDYITQKTHFKDAASVAALQNGEIVVADTRRRCFIYFIRHKETIRNKTQSVLVPESRYVSCSNPTRLAVNTEDHLTVHDCEHIKTFDRKKKIIHQFTPSFRPSCLAVDDNNLIALGHSDKTGISLHNPDGTLVKRLSTPVIVHYMTIHKRRIVFTNAGQKKLHSMDYNGTEVFSVDIKSGEPWNVCCDKDGYIFIVIKCESSFKFGVHHYNPNGEYIGQIIEDCGYAKDITLTPAGDLVIAEGNSVKIYHSA